MPSRRLLPLEVPDLFMHSDWHVDGRCEVDQLAGAVLKRAMLDPLTHRLQGIIDELTADGELVAAAHVQMAVDLLAND